MTLPIKETSSVHQCSPVVSVSVMLRAVTASHLCLASMFTARTVSPSTFRLASQKDECMDSAAQKQTANRMQCQNKSVHLSYYSVTEKGFRKDVKSTQIKRVNVII